MNVELLSITSNAEKVIESAGRTAYLSFGKRKNGSEKAFVKMIVKSGHESVLEHASATFRISGGSRAFTHQLVRHRLCAYTQQSQRYVNESNFKFIEPVSIKNNIKAHKLFVEFINGAKQVYGQLQKIGINNEDARFVLPNATESEIVISANFREWRHIIEVRGDPHAQWEIRKIIIEIAALLKKHAPTVFSDFVIDKNKTCINKI